MPQKRGQQALIPYHRIWQFIGVIGAAREVFGEDSADFFDGVLDGFGEMALLEMAGHIEAAAVARAKEFAAREVDRTTQVGANGREGIDVVILAADFRRRT